MAMAAGGLRGELADSVVAGFGLAFKADALWVGTATDGVEGPGGKSGCDLGGGDPLPDGAGSLARLSLPARALAPAQPGGRSQTRWRGRRDRRGRGHRRRTDRIGCVDRAVGRCAGADAAGPPGPGIPGPRCVPIVWLQSVAFDAVRVHGEADPVLGRTGHQRRPGSLGPGDDGRGGTREARQRGGRLEAELGYGMPVGGRWVGMPRFGIGTSDYGRDYWVGYSLTVAEGGTTHFDLGVYANRRESPSQGTAEHGVLGRLTARW